VVTGMEDMDSSRIVLAIIDALEIVRRNVADNGRILS
jgi:hypothetical protein